ncbi:hypothetical protein IGI04_036052, partial [Brassica rapa subsp. trilocularis]
ARFVPYKCHDPNPGPSDIQRSPKPFPEAQVRKSPELVAGATVRRDHVQLATPDQHPRPPSCSSRRDEAVDTNHTAIGARTKPLEPPEVSPLRGRETHAPSLSAEATANSGHSPPSPTAVRQSRRGRPPSVRRRESSAASLPSPPLIFRAGDSPATRQLGRVDAMPPRRRTTRAQTARVVRDDVDEHEQPAVPPPAAPPVDQDALRQMVQDAARQAAQEALQQIAQETARQAAQEAARVAAQEVARQMAAVQQGPQVQVQQGPQIRVQQVPPVQVQQDQQIPAQHDHQDPVQQVPLPQVPLQQDPAQQFAHGVQDLPPPPPRPHVYPVYDERFYRLTCQMRNMDMEHFSGTVDAVAAHDWKLALQRKLEIIECPPELSLRLTMQYLRGDALIWWEGIRLSHFGPERLTFADFIREFDRKYFPKEAMDRKKCEFEHVSQGEMSIREYEVVFNQLRRFAGVGISEEDLIRKFLSGMRVEIRNRCRVVTYHRLGDLVEKAAEQEAGLAEEQKLTKAVQVKSGKAPESQRRAGDPSGLPICPRCHRSHSGQCMRCLICGKIGHIAKFCRVKPLDTPPVRQIAAPAAPAAAQVCFGCGQPGHFIRDCPRRGNAALPPPPKRLAIAPLRKSPELVAGATVRRDHVQLATPDQHPRPPSCSSRRDEAVDTNHTAIGARTKPLEPPEPPQIPATRRRLRPPFAGAAVDGRRPSAAEKLPQRRRLAAVAAADFPVSRRHPPPSPPGLVPVIRRRLANSAESTRFRVYLSSWMETDTETDFCMPDCMRLWPTIVDRLSCSLEVSINRPRAVSEHYLELCYVRPTSRSDYRTGAIGLLGFYRFYRFLSLSGL